MCRYKPNQVINMNVQPISKFSYLMSQPNFIEIYYDMPYFDAPKSVHHKNVLRRLRLVFNMAEISFVYIDQKFDQMTVATL